MSADAQVLVVGAGPTGLTLALLLALHGVDVALVDMGQQGGPRTRPWSVALQPSSIRTLQTIGGDAPALRNAIVLEQTGRPSGSVPAGDPRRRFTASRRAWSAVALDELTASLHETALRRLDVRSRHTVHRIDLDHDGVVVHARTDSSEVALRAQFVVGCDGGASTVARAAGIPIKDSIRRDHVVVHAEATVEPPLPVLAEHRWQHPGGTVVALPVPPSAGWPTSGRWHVSLELGAAELAHARGERHAMADTLATRTGLLADPAGLELLGFVPVEVCTAERRWRHRALLAGDAAHRDTRVGEHSVDRGIGHAESLGPKLARVVHGESADALLRLYDVAGSHRSNGSGTASRPQRPSASMRSLLRRRRAFRQVAVSF